MLKPDFPKKGMGKEKWKERKGRNGKKNENKEKNRRKERRIPDQRLKGSKKGKEAILDQWKKEDRKSPKPDFHSESFLIGNIPPHMNKEEKTETPRFLSKKNADLEKILLVHDRTFDLWFDRKSRAK